MHYSSQSSVVAAAVYLYLACCSVTAESSSSCRELGWFRGTGTSAYCRANRDCSNQTPFLAHQKSLGFRGGGDDDSQKSSMDHGTKSAQDSREKEQPPEYGRITDDDYRLTPEQITAFREQGCITLANVLTEAEVDELLAVFDRFVAGEIKVPGKDFCDMSKPFGTPYEEWSLVNCMLPTRYYPPLQNNVYERLTASIARQLFPQSNMTKDYDQLLNKRPGKTDAVFAWHQDMAYWPGPEALQVARTDTCTFSLALDDSLEENGCLRYLAGSGVAQTLRPHRPLTAGGRDEGHALTTNVDDNDTAIRLAPAHKGSLTIHDGWVVHGSGGNHSPNRQRRTYVVAYRAGEIVAAERSIGFTHSHNDEINWDTFHDSASHRIKSMASGGGSTSDETSTMSKGAIHYPARKTNQLATFIEHSV